MKVVLLAGGAGTRLAEETEARPKPMVEIGGRPILWHIMKIYSTFGFNEFVVCLGYKGYLIKEYLSNYFLHMADITIDLATNTTEVHDCKAEPWKVTLVDTGLESMTGGRIRRVGPYLDGTFLLTYGDGVANVPIDALLEFHRAHGKLLTVTAVQPVGRFGALSLDDAGCVRSFLEKPKGDGGWINGGFFVCELAVLDYIEGDQSVWEREPMERIAADGQLMAFVHQGFWKPMDTLRDKRELEEFWGSGAPPWKIW